MNPCTVVMFSRMTENVLEQQFNVVVEIGEPLLSKHTHMDM